MKSSKVQHPVRLDTDQTEQNWIKKGFVVKPGHKGKENAKNAEDRAHKENKSEWQRSLARCEKIVVFDTETTGVWAKNNYILSLSWQVLDKDLKTISKQTRYFKNPLPEDRCSHALRVNGLYNDVLEEYGTSDKKTVLEEFVGIGAGMMVGHNVTFDQKFIKSECQREGVDYTLDNTAEWFDTMEKMAPFCNIGRYHGYKNPKLSELADALDIDTGDIDFHRSESDVEVAARCLRKIVKRGLATPLPF